MKFPGATRQMTKAPGSLQELRRRIYRKAKSEKTHRFWGLFVHITKLETLEEAYRIAKGNGGAPGIDGQSFRASSQRDGLRFWRRCEKILSQAGTNQCPTAGWRSRRARAKFEYFKFLVSATAWCRAH